MIKIFVIFFSLIFGLVSQTIAQNDGILINAPNNVKSGDEFLMVMSIPENYMQGVARLQIILPDGFTAKVKKTENADFKFKDQKATFQWLSFPVNRDIEISLSVSVASTIEGYFVVKGVANWINSTEPLHANIYPQVITVLKGETTEDDLLARLRETKITYDDFESEGVACIRQVPFEKNGEVIVNIMVSKGDFNRYGKVQERIPSGYRVENIKSHNAIFVYNERQNMVKYMWMNMPSTSKFIVSYKLIPVKEIDDSNPFIIYGTFYYAVNNQTETVDIQERGIELDVN